MLKWMAIPIFAAAAAAFASPRLPSEAALPDAASGTTAKEGPLATELKGPKVLLIGGTGAGATSSASYSFSGFGATPVVDVSTTAANVSVRDVVVMPTGTGTGTFRFTLEYASGALPNFELLVTVHGGTGEKSAGLERMRVQVRRTP